MKEIKIVRGFCEGDINCLKCGQAIHLYYNGGELDTLTCCGLRYSTEADEINLHIYEITSENPELRNSK